MAKQIPQVFAYLPTNLCPLYPISGDNLRGDKEKEAVSIDHQDQRNLVPEKLSAAEKHQIKRDHRREWLNPGRTQYEEDQERIRKADQAWNRNDPGVDPYNYQYFPEMREVRRYARCDRNGRGCRYTADPDTYVRLVRRDDRRANRRRNRNRRRKRADRLYDDRAVDPLYDPDGYYDGYTRTTRTIRKRADQQLNDHVDGLYDPDYDGYYARTTRTDIRNLDDLEDCAQNCYLYLNTKSLCNCIESECGVDCDDFLN